MRTFLKFMKRKENGIPEEKLRIFDDIIATYFVPGRGSVEGDSKFMEALYENFTEEERFRLWEKSGGCRGTASEKARKSFAETHANKPLPIRLDLYIEEFGGGLTGKTRNIELNEEEKTIKYTFACDECYKHCVSGKKTAPHKIYYESCGGGRLQNLETALNIKLKIKSAYIPDADISKENPCVYTFEIKQ